MNTPEDRQKHVGRARTSTPNTFALYHMAARWGRRAVTGNALSCAEWALEANVGHTPAVRPALDQNAVTMLFLQPNLWSSGGATF